MNRYTGFVVLVVVGFVVGCVSLPNAYALSSETIYESSTEGSGNSAVADTGSYRQLIRHFTQVERCSLNLRRQIRSDTFLEFGRQRRRNILRASLNGFYQCLQKRTGIRIATGADRSNETLRLYLRMPRRIHKADASTGTDETEAEAESGAASAEGSETQEGQEAPSQDGETSGQAETPGSEDDGGSGEGGESGGESEGAGSETQESETEDEGSGEY